MSETTTLGSWLTAAIHDPWMQAGLIIIGTFILEDATTILAAIMVADGIVPLAAALGGLYAGVILGDLGLYGLGRLASGNGRGERYGRHRLLAPFRIWLDTRLILTVFAVRFIPGLRLPTYTASGFLRLHFPRFAITVIAATTIWTTLLFLGSWHFGAATAESLGHWRWVIGLGIAGLIFLIGRANAGRFSPARREAISRNAGSHEFSDEDIEK